jgi:hypothetical protein
MTDSTEVVVQQNAGLVALIERALIDPALDVAKLEKLLDVKERYEREEARKQYVAAMAMFKQDPPKIIKDKHVSYPSSGGKTQYDHATLASVTGALGPALAKVGITYEWETSQTDRITVACILTHVGGHATRTVLSASPDQSGGKNAIQAVGSTVSYLQRYTLLAATGMATQDQDDDGQASEAIIGLPDEDPGDAAEASKAKLSEAKSLPALTAVYNSLTAAQKKACDPQFKDRRRELMMQRPA